MRVSFLSTLPEKEWERYQSELERKAGAYWNRVILMEKDVGRDTQIRDAVRNEGGFEPTHHARCSRETDELRRV